jgi:ArsR family transcriptional regulator, arsenate/arsenite/antimonite-responsive transcriptional repressor
MLTSVHICYRRGVVADNSENLAFDALSDRVRRKILSILSEGEATVTEIADKVGVVGRSTVSSHLRILRTSGVVKDRREGRQRYYSLDAEGSVREAFLYLQEILQSSVRSLGRPVSDGEGERPAPAAGREAG